MSENEKPPTEGSSATSDDAQPHVAAVPVPSSQGLIADGPLTAAARAKHKPGDWRIPRTEPLMKDEVRLLYEGLEAQLEEMHAAGVIDVAERNRRRSVIRRAGKGSLLQRCHECKVVWGSDGSCPRCGKSADPQSIVGGYEGSCMWKLDGEGYRRLFAAFAVDILRVEGEAKSAPAKQAEMDMRDNDSQDATFGSLPSPEVQAQQLAEREDLIQAWKDPRWARPITAQELEWRLFQLELAISRLFQEALITEENRDERLQVARRLVSSPLLTQCECRAFHAHDRCPWCNALPVDASEHAANHAAPQGRASWRESPLLYQMLLAELWADLTRSDEFEPLSCRPVKKRRRGARPIDAEELSTSLFGDDEGESPLSDFPPEPLEPWQPNAVQRGAARGLGVVD